MLPGLLEAHALGSFEVVDGLLRILRQLVINAVRLLRQRIYLEANIWLVAVEFAVILLGVLEDFETVATSVARVIDLLD